MSVGLEECALYYINRLSFQEVAALVARFCGEVAVCQQTVWNWALRKALVLDANLAKEVAACLELASPTITAPSDLYSREAEEVLVLVDGIGVKAQKPLRDKPGEAATGKEAKRHYTDVVLLERPDGKFTTIAGSTTGEISLVAATQAALRREWGDRQSPLPVTALTDGASSIRSDLKRVFGEDVCIILDWYHLEKKVGELLSMSAPSRGVREVWEREVVGLLWRGKVEEAITYLKSLTPRHAQKHEELLVYLDKHAGEIIDYERRRACGKWIGSGCMLDFGPFAWACKSAFSPAGTLSL